MTVALGGQKTAARCRKRFELLSDQRSLLSTSCVALVAEMRHDKHFHVGVVRHTGDPEKPADRQETTRGKAGQRGPGGTNRGGQPITAQGSQRQEGRKKRTQ